MKKILSTAIAAAAMMASSAVNAALVTYNFTSSGSDSSTAVGSFTYDSAAPDILGIPDLVGFDWVVSGGVNNGVHYTLSNLSNFIGEPKLTGFTNDINFWTLDGVFQGVGQNQTMDMTHAITYNNTPIGVASTPIPGAVWLFGTGIAGLVGAGKRKKAKAVDALAV